LRGGVRYPGLLIVKPSHVRCLAAVLAGTVALAASAQPLFASTAHSGLKTTKVHAVIWPNLTITVSPPIIKMGKVSFVVKNRDSHPHEFAVNGITWPKIPGHRSITMTVVFKKRGNYGIVLPDYSPTPATHWVMPGAIVKVK
jgi:hypothetical protein